MTEDAIAGSCIRQRIQFCEKTQYVRIVARILADREQARRRLVRNDRVELVGLYCSLVSLGSGILSGTGLVRAKRSRVRQQLVERAQANQESTSESLVLASQPVARNVGAHPVQ